MAWDGALIVVASGPRRSCRGHGCSLLLLLLLLLRCQVGILHAGHVLLLGEVDLLVVLRMLWMLRAAMAIALRRQYG